MALKTTRSIELILESAFLFHDFEDMPGNGFALAVGVGCENQFVGTLERARDVIEPAGRLGIDLPDHLEVGIGIDRSVLGGEVPDVTERRQHFVGGPQIFVDRLGFGRGLDDDDIHVIPITSGKNADRSCQTRVAISKRTWVWRTQLSNRRSLMPCAWQLHNHIEKVAFYLSLVVLFLSRALEKSRLVEALP